MGRVRHVIVFLMGGFAIGFLVFPYSAYSASRNDAQFISQTVPATMTAGKEYSVSITMKNSGTTTWSAKAIYALMSENPSDNTFFVDAARVYLNPDESIPPDGQKTFVFNAIAPATAGLYNFQWRMGQEGVERFGDKTPNIAIQVTPIPAGSLPPLSDPPGPYIDRPSDNNKEVSFSSKDKILMTYFFYWYDATDPNFASAQAQFDDHPPSYDDYTWKSVTYFEHELHNFIDAGIDVILPVYWGFPNPAQYRTGSGAAFSNTGLINLVQAMRNLEAKGFKVPKIGMCYDTSTLHLNPVGNLNLTLPEHRPYFYGTVRDFYSLIPPEYRAVIDGKPVVQLFWALSVLRYDQGAFNYLRAQFQQHFFQDLYIIRDVSWKVTSDNDTRWGASFWGAYIYGCAQIGAGYHDAAILGRAGDLRSREGGEYYKRSWQTAIDSQRNIILLETWNEMYEATDIDESAEYGRQYINLTSYYSNLWRGRNNASQFTTPTPVTLETGQKIRLSVTSQNKGLSVWRKDSGFRLHLHASPSDMIVDLDPEEIIDPGASTTFATSWTAPTIPGNYTLTGQMEQANVGSFGSTFSIPVTVNTPATQSITDLNTSLSVFPNPWRVDRDRDQPTQFSGLSLGDRVKIYSLSSQWITTLVASAPTVTWNHKTSEGQAVVSGVYLYLVFNENGQKLHSGKIAILR